MINKVVYRVSFKSLFLLVNFYLVISANIQVIDSASCLFVNDQIGQCVKFEECPSAVSLSKRGINPGFCNLEEGIVCCTDNVKETVTSINSGHQISEVQNDYPQNIYENNHKDSNVNAQNGFEGNPNNQRRKHSVGKPGRKNNVNSPSLKGNNNGDEPYQFENPESFYSEIDTKSSRRPGGSNSQSSNDHDQSYFLPPGLAKKKPWRDEKTTENEYYYEHVGKKPGRGPNRKGPNKYGNDNSEPSRHVNENSTRRSERKGTTNYDSHPSNPPCFEYSNYESTTKRNRRLQETYTTKCNDFSNKPSQNNGGSENEFYNSKPERRPGGTFIDENYFSAPNSEGNFRPQQGSQTNFEQGTRPELEGNLNSQKVSRPPENNSPSSRPWSQNKRTISVLKCEEYSKEITENITGLPLTTDPDPVIIPVRKCIQPQQLIVGGENTKIGEFPHMAAVGFRDNNKKRISWNCGGTLISEQFVMTAAHCTSTSLGRPVKVRLGEYNLMKNDDGAHPVDYAIKEIITHPEYRPPSKYNDIALLKLSRRVTFFKHIRPACLYGEDTFSVSMAIATGWGRLHYDGSVSEILQKVALNIVDNNTCNRLYKVKVKTEVLSRGIIESQMCAGDITGGKDTCQGDSGGPLSITSTKCIHHVIGITSFGKSCALPNSTGVYTRVSAYLPWIESIVWPND